MNSKMKLDIIEILEEKTGLRFEHIQGLYGLEQIKGASKFKNGYFLDKNEKIIGFNLQLYELADISFLKFFTDVTHLNLFGNEIKDISPLAGLSSLKHLDLKDNQIPDISTLSVLSGLICLNLEDNSIGDISPLMYLRKIKKLFVDNRI